MKVNVMGLHETGDMRTDTMFLLVDDETLITVVGFGTDEYKWKVHNCGQGNEDYDPMVTVREIEFNPPCGCDYEKHIHKDGFMHGGMTLGPAMIWAEPITFAHVVMDLINGLLMLTQANRRSVHTK